MGIPTAAVPAAVPTLPMLPSAGARRNLLAGVTFVELAGAGNLSIRGLREWFEQYVVITNVMPRPVMVNEPSAGSIPPL